MSILWRNPAGILYRVFNLKVDRQLSSEYFTSDAIYNGSAGMILYYYMCRSWQDCCRRGDNRSWPSVSVESVDSECWCLNNAISLRFHNAVNSGRTSIYFGKLFKKRCLTPTVDKVALKNLEVKRQWKVLLRKWLKKFRKTGSRLDKNRNRVDKCIEMNGHHFQHLL